MTRERSVVAGGCGFLLILAGVFVVAPELLGPTTPLLQRVLDTSGANTKQSLFVIGLAAVLGSILIARDRGGVTTAVRPDLNQLIRGVDSTAAGSEFDDRLQQLIEADDSTTRSQLAEQIRDDIRETAVTVLMRTETWTASEARAHLDRGAWTDDPQATAFFTQTPPPWTVRFHEWLGARSVIQQRLECVIDDLEDRLEMGATEAGIRQASAKPGQNTPSSAEQRPLPPNQRSDATRHQVAGDTDATTVDNTIEQTARVPDEVISQQDIESSALVESRTFGLAVGLVAVALGLVTGTKTPFLLGVVAVGYTISKYVTDAPPPAVAVTRTVGSDSPIPGDRVDVRVTVENVGDRPLSDLRVIDGPPDPLRVVEGSPSLLTSLQPGGTDTFSYTVQAKRGAFTFAETQLITRSLSNVRERTTTVTVPMRITCATLLDDLLLQEQTSQRIGAVKTDEGGTGIEFFGTREYRAGDPLSRINWNHLAKTGDLTTVQFREQRAPIVSIVIDQRDAARVAPSSAELDGVDLSVYAAEQAFLTLLDAGTQVGLITYGEQLTDIEPGSDATQRARVQSQLRAATDRYAAALGESAIESEQAVQQRGTPDIELLEEQVPRNAQVLVLSPATDEFAVEAVERLCAFGHPVTLLSPAVVGTEFVGQRRQRLERACRLQAIRETGAHVVDWQPEEAVQMAIARATTHYV